MLPWTWRNEIDGGKTEEEGCCGRRLIKSQKKDEEREGVESRDRDACRERERVVIIMMMMMMMEEEKGEVVVGFKLTKGVMSIDGEGERGEKQQLHRTVTDAFDLFLSISLSLSLFYLFILSINQNSHTHTHSHRKPFQHSAAFLQSESFRLTALSLV